MTTKLTATSIYYLNINGQYFRLIDVPGDGDCFYHSVLRNSSLAERFKNVNSLRLYITGMVSLWFENDGVLRSLFLFEGKDYKAWCKTTACNGTWATTFDMLIFSYVLKVNIVSVGNYLEGFLHNDMRAYFLRQNQHLETSLHEWIPENPVIHIFFHAFGNPLQRTSNGNHFGYLESIPTPTFAVEPNTIKAVGEQPVKKKSGCQGTLLKDFVIEKSDKKKRKCDTNVKFFTAKEKKQSILATWKVETNLTSKIKLNALIDQYKDEAKSLGDKIITQKTECAQHAIETEKKAFIYKGRVLSNSRRSEYRWCERSCIIYFYFHPFMGYQSLSLTATIFGVKQTTLKGWLAKKHLISRWLPIVEKLDGLSVKQAIPTKHAHKFDAPDSRYAVKYLPLAPYRKRLQEDANQLKLSVVKSGFDTRLGIVAAKKEDAILVKRNARRVRGIRGPKKYLDIRNSIEKEVKEKWKSGVPITRPGIYKHLKSQFNEGDFHDNFLSKVEQADKLSNFVTRTLQYFGFCVRKSTVSQSIPRNWRELAIAGALRIRSRFKEEDVQVVIAADETFLRFHEASSTVVAPKGSKRVGTAIKSNEKEGCTVMVSMEMISSQLLPPLIIFKGQFGKTLMKKWQNYSKSSVLFTSNHWMTGETNILYLQYLIGLFKGRKIGLIYDNAPSHVSTEVMDWIASYNRKAPENEQVIVEFVDPCLTSIYQPPDVVMNAPLKRLIRRQYHDHIHRILQDDARSSKFKAGDKVTIPRETLIEFVEKAYDEINSDNIRIRWIAESFNKCGLNPWGDDTCFLKHLDKLNESGMYKALTEAHAAEILERRI